MKIGYVEDHVGGFNVLAEGKVDAYISDDILLFGLIKASSNPQDYEVVGDFLSFEPYGLVLPRGDPDLRQLVNATLSRLSRAGIIEQIHAKWFDPLGVPMPDLLRASFMVNAVPD